MVVRDAKRSGILAGHVKLVSKKWPHEKPELSVYGKSDFRDRGEPKIGG